MLKKTRCDGTPIRDLPPFTILMPYVMPTRTGSMIYYEQELEVTKTLAQIKAVNRELIKRREILTLFDVVICAAVRAIALRPRANRFIAGGRFYQRNQITVNFVAKKELTDEGEEVNVKIPFGLYETLETVALMVKRYVRKAVSDSGLDNDKVVKTLVRFPHFVMRLVARGLDKLDAHNLMPADMIESDPCFCSLFLTNVGSFGLETPPFHHLYERGNCPIFISMGKVKTENRLQADGSITERKTLLLRYSFDDRIADGTYMGGTLALVKKFVEDPEALIVPPVIDPAIVAEHGLKEPEPQA
jgi:2-oxoacid dehydrogenases acyltransferase (catalytic domain)